LRNGDLNMKIIKTASGKKQIKISKKEWEVIGKKAGWTKEAQMNPDYVGGKTLAQACEENPDMKRIVDQMRAVPRLRSELVHLVSQLGVDENDPELILLTE